MLVEVHCYGYTPNPNVKMVDENKTNKNDLIIAIIILIIGVIVILFFIGLILLEYSRLRQCENNQSPYCMQFSCVNPGPLCGNDAIRYSADGSTYYCASAPLTGHPVPPNPT